MENRPTLSQSVRIWSKVGLLSFGGPAAQIALMHREIVDRKNWLSEVQFLNALNFCMLLPGPEAMQLATYAGWRINGVLGGLIAGLLFVIPGALVIALLASVYVCFGELPLVNALFLGVKSAVVIIVIEALLRVSKKALKTKSHRMIAAISFISIFFLNLPYPLIVFGAALFGYLAFPNKDNFEPISQKQLIHKTLITIIVWLIIWWAPILIIYLFFDYQFLTEIMIFFSKLAVVTFGGAYAVLAYMAQEVVSTKDWLTAGEMMDGLGLAETTPGPLILVTEFVGFIAGYKEGGIITAIIAAFLTLWVTFAPCFLWIFAGAPYIDWIGSKSRLHGALSGITAAVVGVILNLSTWFTLHVLFESVNLLEFGSITVLLPEISTLNITAAVLALFSAWLLLKQDWNIIWILIINALLAATISTF